MPAKLGRLPVLTSLFSLSLLLAPQAFAASASHTITAEVTDPKDYEISITEAAAETTRTGGILGPGEEVAYTISYGSKAGIDLKDLTVEAKIGLARRTGAAGWYEVADYVSLSAAKAYGGAEPVVDPVNQTIFWEIPLLPAGAGIQTVGFKLRTKSSLPYSGTFVWGVKTILKTKKLVIEAKEEVLTSVRYKNVEDLTAPPEVRNLEVTPSLNEVVFSWENPQAGNFKGARILKREGRNSPQDEKDGNLLYEGIKESFTDGGLEPGKTYSYTVFTFDDKRNFSFGKKVRTATLPEDVANLLLNIKEGEGEEGAELSWKNPENPNFLKVTVLRKFGSPPESPTDGTIVYDSKRESFIDKNFKEIAFYRIFVVDNSFPSQYSQGKVISLKKLAALPTSAVLPAKTERNLRPKAELLNLNIIKITSAEAQVFFITSEGTLSKITYGPGKNFGLTASGETLEQRHQFSLTNLSPNTTYYFKVVTEKDGTSFYSDSYVFKTAQLAPLPKINKEEARILFETLDLKTEKEGEIEVFSLLPLNLRLPIEDAEDTLIQAVIGQHLVNLSSSGSNFFIGSLLTPFTKDTYPLKVRVQSAKGNLDTVEILKISVLPKPQVFERVSQKPILDAKVTLWARNPLTKDWEVWDGSTLKIPNPTATAENGTFSFILPAGDYYLSIAASGYSSVRTGPFTHPKNGILRQRVALDKEAVSPIERIQTYTHNTRQRIEELALIARSNRNKILLAFEGILSLLLALMIFPTFIATLTALSIPIHEFPYFLLYIFKEIQNKVGLGGLAKGPKIYGKIKGPQGNPLSHAAVYLSTSEGRHLLNVTFSDREGQYRLGVGPGSYIIRAKKEGFSLSPEIGVHSPGEEAKVDIILIPHPQFSRKIPLEAVKRVVEFATFDLFDIIVAGGLIASIVYFVLSKSTLGVIFCLVYGILSIIWLRLTPKVRLF